MSDYQEGEVLVNPQTGERIQLVRGEWKPFTLENKQGMTHVSTSVQGVPQTAPHMYMKGSQGEIKEVPSWLKFGAGAGAGMQDLAMNLANFVSPSIVSNEQIQQKKEQNAPLYESTPGNLGKFAGESVALYPVGGAVGKGMEMLGAGATRIGMPIGKKLAALMGGATEGAVQGTLTAEPDNRAEGATGGAMFGAAYPVGAAALKKFAAAAPPTPNARKLLNVGVDLTPGQRNPSGTINQLEQALMAVPFIGKAIAGQREKGWQQVQNVIGEQASPPNFKPKTVGDVSKLVSEIGDAYDTAYDVGKGYPIATLSVMQTQGSNVPLSQLFKRAVATGNATNESKSIAKSFLDNELSGITNMRGGVQSDNLFALRSRVRAEIRNLDKAPNAPYGASNILQKAEQAITDVLNSQLPSDVIPKVKAIDARYGNFKILQDAVKRAADRPEGFTPAQASAAVRAATIGSEYARGGGRLRDITKAGYDVFQPTEPATGRVVATLSPLAAGTVAAAKANLPATIAATGVGAALWGTKTGRNLLSGDTKTQQYVRDLLRSGRRTFTPQEQQQIARLLQTTAIANADQ